VTYTYDSNGNLTFDGVNRYVWDARNQLIAVSGVGAANYAYDAIGRRTAQTQGSTTTTYLHDRGNLIQESRGGEMAHYMTGPALDQVFSRSDSNGTETYLRDGLGSILGLADATGNIVTQYQYGPYGDTTAAAGAGRNSLQYGGRENDENGLYFYRARYYKPAIGRFISQDPIGLVAGVNRYAYADGNPVQLDDPTGLYGAVSTTITGGLDGLGGQISTTTNVNGTITTQTGFGFGAGGSVSTTFTDSAPGDLGPSPGVTYGVAYSDTITLGSLTFNVDASVDSSGDWSLDGSLSLPYGLGDWGGELSPNGFRRQRSRGIGESGFLGFFRRETRCP
jgi:RHS repeat-associated protein